MSRRNLRALGAVAALIAAGLVAIIRQHPAPTLEIPASLPSQAQALPQCNHPVTVLRNLAYDVGYSETMKDPLWVRYSLQESDRVSERLRRPEGGFAPDSRTSAGVTSHDYVGSGYDRGHMAPSYAIGEFHGREAQMQTFVMSNVVPQNHRCNDGVWNSIERMEADDFVKRFGSIEVVDGPVFENEPAKLASGVAVPKAFYKAIRRPDGQIIAFVVPQDPQSPLPETYLKSVAEIEKLTGIDPFPDDSRDEKSRQRHDIW